MYTEFFGLQRPPFNSTLDSTFFCDCAQHVEALAALTYAVQERKGLAVVTGDVGAGKSLIGRMLIDSLEAADVAYIGNPLLGRDLLGEVCNQFHLPSDAAFNTMERLATLEEHLLAQHSKERAAVLLIDDAHLLTDQHFEQLRLMANLEVAGGKLLQIVLLGQRELLHHLGTPALKTLRQRVFRSLQLTALSRDLTERYVCQRLQAAGAHETGLFEPAAVDLVHKFTGGVPRLINNLCDNVMLCAFSEDTRRIDEARVHRVINEIMASEPGGAAEVRENGRDIDHAVEEIVQRYVRSLEAQVSVLDSTCADSDRRIQELGRLSARLQTQERQLGEQHERLERQTRDLHKLMATLQEQEHRIDQRDRAIVERMTSVERLCTRLDEHEKSLVEREARMVQQHRESERLSQHLVEQDNRLTERAGFIEKKLSNRHVAFDRELNECKRAINRKWQDMKQLVVEHVTRDAEWTKRLATIDVRLKRFETLEPDLARVENRLLTTSSSVHAEFGQRVSEITAVRDNAAASIEHCTVQYRELQQQAERQVHALKDSVSQATGQYAQIRSEMECSLSSARSMLDEPREILDRAGRQVEQVERMAGMIQKASASLHRTLDSSAHGAKELHRSAELTRTQLAEVSDDATHLLEELTQQTVRTSKLRDVFREVFQKSEAQVQNLSKLQSETDAYLGRMLRQVETLRESAQHPTRLVQELRTVGSAAERNIHEGVMKLTELKTMIDKAERARRSIEALVQATRRVAEARRISVSDATTMPRGGAPLGEQINESAPAAHQPG